MRIPTTSMWSLCPDMTRPQLAAPGFQRRSDSIIVFCWNWKHRNVRHKFQRMTNEFASRSATAKHNLPLALLPDFTVFFFFKSIAIQRQLMSPLCSLSTMNRTITSVNKFLMVLTVYRTFHYFSFQFMCETHYRISPSFLRRNLCGSETLRGPQKRRHNFLRKIKTQFHGGGDYCKISHSIFKINNVKTAEILRLISAAVTSSC